ncbi:MAG: DUF3224 domain-containing protein [Bacteroidota bacterium]
MKAKGTYTVKKWEETPYRQISTEMKMTKASVLYEFSGDLQGIASVEYLMFYRHFDQNNPHKASASYVGHIYFDGKLSDKSGSFVLEDNGTFEAGSANSSLRIVDGSGTGALKGIYGTGIYHANKDGYHLELDYNFH